MKEQSDLYRSSLKRFKERILPAESALIIAHDFPDPDALGASVGLQHLLLTGGVKRCDIAFSGFIGRAENRAMISEIDLKYESLSPSLLDRYEKLIVVDTMPHNGNISLDNSNLIDAVLDHHSSFNEKVDPDTLVESFPMLGATSTLVTLYLTYSNIHIPSNIATALFYGIKTDTNDLGRNCSLTDVDCYKMLFDLVDHAKLSRIENPPREPEYLQLLHTAAESLSLYGDFGYMHLGEISMPDFIPEMADIFHPLKGLEWIVCSGIFKGQLLFSIRSKNELSAGLRAHLLATKQGGSGGGHNKVAAGRIPIPEVDHLNFHNSFTSELLNLFSVDKDIKTQMLDYKDE